MIISAASRALVACNIYVSAGGNPLHKDLLLRLLTETQEHCRRTNKSELSKQGKELKQKERVVVVHAFRDGPYDRSSFHLAGSPALVADVGSSLAGRAIEALTRFDASYYNQSINTMTRTQSSNAPRAEETNDNGSTSAGQRHPTVGLVDHVSVLPLEDETAGSITGSVAREIGEIMKTVGADVLYYGNAHPSGKELAVVRRESTRFFDTSSANPPVAVTNTAGQVTVGAPPRFVENFNIRLQPRVPKKMARTLTESVRERSGRGLPHVEALTLKYGPDQYEVACNLLDPTVTSSNDIEKRMRIWEKGQEIEDVVGSYDLIETAYRVGTTEGMCLDALHKATTDYGERAHNDIVRKRLEADFST
mmetsp:Transcript_27566/g.75212  ORF Transcript_27566/g.75212 Transcript_27566/m.75212 type:complete len:364 (-) Transcript_27566:98-1189(-)|eukprot:CAMPEP_0172371438 /NCGR_PEP_ID=MMETSP1060-20121228/42907_1 /TAXON_ID=37318 /ORGANISM="Pseudo-nitzschia pungens, Strain cf. cingulata" /LENGTH=363 /DNA_ID=CAMNT_0013097061 /DNA_START=58 /DNA_END=1149 /DNA_ORIENTATION=+